MTNFIGIQKPPPLLPFPPPSVPHTLCLASKSRECSRKKEREMGKHTKAVEKKMCVESWKSQCMLGGCQLAVPAASPCRARSAAPVPRAVPDPDGWSWHVDPSLPAAPPVSPSCCTVLHGVSLCCSRTRSVCWEIIQAVLMPSCTALGLGCRPASGRGPWWQCAGWEGPFPGLLSWAVRQKGE